MKSIPYLSLALLFLAGSTATHAQAGTSGQPQQAQKVTQDLSNAKQFALGIMLFLTDNKDVYPYVSGVASLQKIVMPYIKNERVFKPLNPNGDGKWRFNMSLAGVRMVDLLEPAKTPLVYDIHPHPNGRRVVAFADGHAKLVSETEWKSYDAFLKLKLKRHGKPIKS